METVKLKALLILEIHLCVLWNIPLCLQGHPSGTHDNVIDLLAALNMTQPIKGVSRTHGEEPGTLVYKLRPRAPHLSLPHQHSHFLLSVLQGSMGVHLVARQALHSSSSLLSLSSSSSPILQLLSSTLNNTLRLDYLEGKGAQVLSSLLLPGGNPFSGGDWVQLALGLEPDRLALFVNCQEVVAIQRKREERLNMDLPQDLVITLASTPGESDSKFVGYVKTAEISSRAYLKRPWHCANVTDFLPPSGSTPALGPDSRDDGSQVFQEDMSSTSNKPQTPYWSLDQASHYPQDAQRDQPQRGVVLGPPGSPQGAKSAAQAQGEERLRGLEQRLEEMATMLDMVKAQNTDLQSRVQYLEGCVCVRRQRCQWEGREVEEGQRWRTHLNSVCTCTSGQVTCEANIKDPCLSSPCHNGGVCLALSSDPMGFRCSCPPNTKGPVCHRQLRQACWEPMPENSCQAGWPFQRRWAFNPISGLCEDFIHCTGNSSNNFLSLNACRVQCVLGACCFRQPKQGVHAGRQDNDRYGYNISNVDGTLEGYSAESWYSNIELNLTELEGVGEDGRKEHSKAQRERSGSDCSPDFTYTCERLTLTQCQVRVKELPEEAEAVSFSRGRTCSEVSCSQGCGCLSRRHLRKYGERFRQGCEDCVCTHGGVDCACAHLTQRKEIRDLTLRERKMYQRAIRRLRAKPAMWEGFAQMRAEFSPQAGSDAYFLPWHRYFLRLVERELQALSSCQLAVPYFEWTVDAGSMRSSAAWQAGLFGGDGDPGSGCVPQHPFQGWTARSHWSPCLKRSFNSTVWLPDAVTLQTIVNQGDFQLLSQSLQAFSGLFRLWVGGHMASPIAAYDPLYLSHMAFMDKIWTQWQEKHQRMDWVKNTYEYNQGSRDGHTPIDSHSPARKRHVKMKPFDVTPDDVRSSRCVVYVPITIGAPCNVTMFEKPPQRSDYTDDHNIPRRHKHYFDKRSGIEGSDFDPNGYDRDGFDRSGWNRRGFGMDGLNRDLIDREGYDMSGFNRYGVNRSNITWFGMRWDGVFESKEEANNSGHRDRDERREVEPDEVMSEIFSDGGYSVYGFDPFGLDRSGFDAFGFRPDGYDKDSCNWFLNGPHYMRFYFHTQQQLMATSTQALKRITRTCPPITSLPQHWATQEWMALDPEQSSALIGRLEHERIEQKWADSDESTTATPRNKWNAWLPITPDHRYSYKQGCEPDSTPHNVSYNTIDGCQTCTCRGGNRECSPLPCPPLGCSEKESVPGECCPKCRGCIHSGIQYANGAKWRSVERPCDVCYCEEGRVHCERESCQTPCKNPTSPPSGSCCPVCHGCGVNGHDFPNGAVIPGGDHCQDCSCVNGNVVCSPLSCPVLSCPNPVYRPGDCCPRCDKCEYESKVYLDGQTFPSRTDSCRRCHCSGGKVSCEHMDASSCPTPPCSHPAKIRGQCCPTCDKCEYDRRVYADGKAFSPPGSGPCLQCRCKGGNVICHEERCPPVQCSNPIIDPQLCCPICKACVLEGTEYEDGSQWHPEGPCSSCSCVNGETVCTHTQCPPTDCQHPTKNTGSCCAGCDSCTYNHRIYGNRQRFTTPDQPCHVCTCLDGTVECTRRPCPPLNCTNSHTPAGECCPKCPDCSFENRIFVDGEAFPNPVSGCEECVCVEGRVDCHPPPCQRPNCNAPLAGTCCHNNCNGCSYAGKEYPNGQEFPHPTDPCRTCNCINGNVQCLTKRCPPLQCSNPNNLPGDCCPQCPAAPLDCVHGQQTYRHNQRFYDPADACHSCLCSNGTVHCQRKPCPHAHCSHPITQQCCRTCEGCLYDGRERASGETWDDLSDPCGVCVCREGSVKCERKRCPPANCKYPVQRKCCMTCDGCMFDGREQPDGFEFVSATDPCSVCTCYGGEVVCTRLPCYQECTHAVTLPGQCCGECNRCFHNNVVLKNGQSFPDPSNPCSECTCQSGSVRCSNKRCPPAPCQHAVTNPCGCPVCEGCLFDGVTYVDGQVLQRGGCQECRCSRGEVVCAQRRCPAVACPHPALDGCACAECDGCSFNGRDCNNGERFTHPTDRCQLCSCLNGGVVCVPGSCPAVSCTRPVTPRGECCPVCTGVCLHQGIEHESGSSFSPPTDPCSTCSCLNEVATCHKRPCPRQCSHPVPSDACCPACDACLYEGVVHTHRHTFTPSSNPCQRCTCVRGTVTCVPLVCPPTPCSRPVTQPGQCCPQCTVCMLEGQEYGEGQTWTLSSNRCSTCTCQAGEARCVSPECPKLTCMHQVTDQGACCPRCRGCMYGGEEHAEGSSWFADSTPCMTCMCVDGVTTCSEVRCLSPCINTINVPGECCPVCADCVFEGRVYGPRDSFQPADDPCQICTCEVMPDGQQHLRCYHKQCPSLVDCPKNNILFSGPDVCCPVCAQPLSNCTATLIGNEVLATDDPCFTCQCKDLTWTCLHQSCQPLTCSPNEQFTPPDSCCPACEECVIEGQGVRVPNGASWTDSDDDCVTCTCNLGHIECTIEECLPVVCQDSQIPVKIPGECCHGCQDSVSCTYQGTVYQSNEQWEVDECTSCSCVSGDVHCHSERCPPLTCATDEMPAVIPGVCCPHCLPRPATCIVFGDPHYRTFDGRMLHFQGACTYVLAQDCKGGDFSIHVTNDNRGRKGVSWTKEVTVFIGDVAVQLLQDWVVKVNDEVVTLPFLKEPYIYVERQANIILLNTNIGLKVLWNGCSHLEVSVPGSYKSHTCGLCGNFNNYQQDDQRMPSGKISLSEAAFGNSWRVTNGSHSLSDCHPGEDVDPCKDAGYQARKGANSRCKVLKSSVFKACHRVVPPEPWYGACVYDQCACGANTDECLCDTLEAYAGQCREAGVVLQWRSPSLCAVGCPAERGFVFDECGPPCPVTCFNVDVPLGVIESHCFKPCVPGCQCPAGLVLHNYYCIPPEKCPKIIHGSTS